MARRLLLGFLGCAAAVLACASCRESTGQGLGGREEQRSVFFVRPPSEAAGKGSNWADALDGLPSSLQRGAVYWLSAGDYGAYDFDDSSRQDLGITLRKASAVAHGTEVGWAPQLADGPAVFGPLRFEGSHYTFDGGQPNGFKVVGAVGTEAAVHIEGNHIALRQVEIDGGFRKVAGKQVAGSCNGANVHGDDVELDRCEIHRIADDGLGLYGDRIRVLQSEVYDLDGCGTDGECGPCYNGHSDGIELSGASQITLLGNLVYDVRSNAALFMDDWSGSAVKDLVVRDNIFYTPDTGFAVYVQKVKGARFEDNVIWGKTQGSKYGGLSIGPGIEDLHMKNNVILNINFSHMGVKYDPRRHGLDGNRFGMLHPDEHSAGPGDQVGDPGFARIPMSDADAAHRRKGLTRTDFEAAPQ
jgi:hypothetical protein